MLKVRYFMPGELLNHQNPYIQSLHEAGFHMHELRTTRGGTQDSLTAIAYRKEEFFSGAQTGKKHLLWLSAVNGEAATTSHVSAAFLNEMEREIDTVVGLSSPLSRTALEKTTYNHDERSQVLQIVDLYKAGVLGDTQTPLVILGHSMGGTLAPLVAKELLQQGFRVENLVLIAPAGLVERSSPQMVWDFLSLAPSSRYYPDVPTLYPSPLDIAGIQEAYTYLLDERRRRPLSLQEREEFSYYELMYTRAVTPDMLTKSNLSKSQLERIAKIDDEMTALLSDQTSDHKVVLERLQKRRTRTFNKPVRDVISGILYNQPTIVKTKGIVVARHLLASIGEIKETVANLARERLFDDLQDVLRYAYDTHPERKLALTLIAGKNDPIVGKYSVGGVREQYGAYTYTELLMGHSNHFTLPDDPVRMAQTVKRLIAN